MAVTRRQSGGIEILFGLAADSKPAAPTGSKFYETDTGDAYTFSGSEWFSGDDMALGSVSAGALGQGTSKRITATVNTTLVISPPAGTWRYLKVSNLTADTWVSVGINEAPLAAPSANPGVAADWEAGYDVPGGGSELVPLIGTLTTIRMLSSASASVVLNLVA